MRDGNRPRLGRVWNAPAVEASGSAQAASAGNAASRVQAAAVRVSVRATAIILAAATHGAQTAADPRVFRHRGGIGCRPRRPGRARHQPRGGGYRIGGP
jgi:hypothetical protein